MCGCLIRPFICCPKVVVTFFLQICENFSVNRGLLVIQVVWVAEQWSPKVSHPNPRTCEGVGSQSKGASQAGVRTYTLGGYPGLPSRARCNHRSEEQKAFLAMVRGGRGQMGPWQRGLWSDRAVVRGGWVQSSASLPALKMEGASGQGM